MPIQHANVTRRCNTPFAWATDRRGIPSPKSNGSIPPPLANRTREEPLSFLRNKGEKISITLNYRLLFMCLSVDIQSFALNWSVTDQFFRPISLRYSIIWIVSCEHCVFTGKLWAKSAKSRRSWLSVPIVNADRQFSRHSVGSQPLSTVQ